MTPRENQEDRLQCPHVLLVSDSADFARSVVGRWQIERHIPEITLATSDIWHGATDAAYDLLIVEVVRQEQLPMLAAPGGITDKPAICVTEDEKAAAHLRGKYPNVLVIPKQEGWTNLAILLAGEALRRVHAVGRARRAERLATETQNDAALGRYMLAVRPKFNNALTSILGNTDLLLLAPGKVIDETRDQVQTIHTMALRLNQIMQRFSSLDTEMRAEEKQSRAEERSSARSLAD